MSNKFHTSINIYRHAIVTDTTLEAMTSIGDFSKVNASCLKENVRIDRNNYIDYVKMGAYSYTGRNTIILHSTIGSFCSISWNVSIGGANHDYSRMTQHSFLYNSGELMSLKQPPVYDRF